MKNKKGLSAFKAVHNIAEAYRREFRFGKVLNTMAKAWDEWREIVEKETLKEIRTDEKQKMNQYLNFMGWLLTITVFENGESVTKKRPRFKLIKSMLPSNPNGDRSPKEILKAIAEGYSLMDLKLFDSEKIELIEVESRKGGIKPHRISVITWGVHKHVIEILGDAWTPGDLTEEKVKEAIKAYHDERKAKYEEKAEKAQSAEIREKKPVVEDVTTEFVEAQTSADAILELLEQKEIKSTELSDVDKIEAVRELASGAVKGSLTRRIKELA